VLTNGIGLIDASSVSPDHAVAADPAESNRIEIIRGPGSALYGADAYSGVINIITRTPGEGRNSVTVSAGNGGVFRTTMTNSGRAGNVGYRVLISPDEEIGSIASAPVLADFARLGHVGLTYEPALADGALASVRKGSGNFHVVVHGRAAHAGRDFASGRNAVMEAARLAQVLHALNGRREGVTLNVAKIDGGSPLNMVPDIAVLRFNVRFPSAADAAWLEGEIAAVVASTCADGLHAHLHGRITRGAKPFNAAQERLFGAVREVGALLGQDIAWKPSGGVCEGNNLFASGLPNIDSLGVRGGDIHSEAEHAWPASFVERAQLSALTLMKLASGDIDAHAIRAAMAAKPETF
jgi:glutamate carboxypeptidase